jgi:hypothetical protein
MSDTKVIYVPVGGTRTEKVFSDVDNVKCVPNPDAGDKSIIVQRDNQSNSVIDGVQSYIGEEDV